MFPRTVWLFQPVCFYQMLINNFDLHIFTEGRFKTQCARFAQIEIIWLIFFFHAFQLILNLDCFLRNTSFFNCNINAILKLPFSRVLPGLEGLSYWQDMEGVKL